MYPGPSVSSFVFVIAVSQVVVEAVFFLVTPSVGMALELGFSTLGVVENGLIVKQSLSFLSSYHRRYDLVKAGLYCRILEFFLYRSFIYSPLHVADVLEGFA